MKRTMLATALTAIAAVQFSPLQAADPLGKGMIMYMQMGGNAGDGATWARTNGALAAGDAFGIKVIEQYSAWQPEKMLEQFRQAVAAKPDCIEIMGHPGNNAFEPLVKQAADRGILVTVGNSPLTKIQKTYGSKGTGYAGVDLYTGGAITASKMLEAGLKSGDKALVYGLLGEAERGQSDKGLKDTLEKAGVKVDYIEISPEANSDSSLAVPVLTAYLAKNPDVKAHRHPARRHHFGAPEGAAGRRQEARGRHRRRHRPVAGDHRRSGEGLDHRHVGSAALSAGLPAGDAVRAVQAVLALPACPSTPVPTSSRRRRSRRWSR